MEDIENCGRTWTELHTTRTWEDTVEMDGDLFVIVDGSDWK